MLGHVLCNKKLHDKHDSSEQLCIGDRVRLYTPVVSKGNTKKFTSYWRGPYTIVDKLGDVTYKIQIIGGIQTLVVHRNRLKLCHTPPSEHIATTAHSPMVSQYTLPTYSPVSGVGGYTTLDTTYPHSRPARNLRPPPRYEDYLCY